MMIDLRDSGGTKGGRGPVIALTKKSLSRPHARPGILS